MLRDMAESRQTGPKWTNPSVLALAGNADPMTTVLEGARARVFDAMEKGWTGPPFDPLQLADMLKIPTLSHIEAGHANPTWATVRDIADALGVSIGQLAKVAEKHK